MAVKRAKIRRDKSIFAKKRSAKSKAKSKSKAVRAADGGGQSFDDILSAASNAKDLDSFNKAMSMYDKYNEGQAQSRLARQENYRMKREEMTARHEDENRVFAENKQRTLDRISNDVATAEYNKSKVGYDLQNQRTAWKERRAAVSADIAKRAEERDARNLTAAQKTWDSVTSHALRNERDSVQKRADTDYKAFESLPNRVGRHLMDTIVPDQIIRRSGEYLDYRSGRPLQYNFGARAQFANRNLTSVYNSQFKNQFDSYMRPALQARGYGMERNLKGQMEISLLDPNYHPAFGWRPGSTPKKFR